MKANSQGTTKVRSFAFCQRRYTIVSEIASAGKIVADEIVPGELVAGKFIPGELVTGELSGRIVSGRGIEDDEEYWRLATQLATGVAAVHGKGVIHLGIQVK